MRLLVAVLVLVVCTGVARAEKRVALVIGNSSYKNSPLRNPKNDAVLMTATLKEMGFDVVTAVDVSRRDMGRAVKTFGKALRRAGTGAVGLLYYSGHGIQSRGENFLIPIDAEIETEADLTIESMSAADILQQMEDAGNRLNLVILDACRNNPLPSAVRSGSKGLARVKAASGSLIAFAAAPGQVAADGKGQNSPYLSALVEAMKVPGLAVEQVFKKTRVKVESQTGGAQTPWEESSLKGDFYFIPASQSNAEDDSAGARSVGVTGVQGAVDDRTLELSYWNSVKDSGSAAALSEFLKQFPSGTFAGLARIKLEELGTKVAVGVFPDKETPVRTYKPGETFTECDNCPEMVVIPSGSFTMGSPKSEKKREAAEGPQRKVEISKPFAAGKFEVTVDQYTTFVKESGHLVENGCWIYKGSKWVERKNLSYKKPGYRQKGTFPVTCLSWWDAQAYVEWLGKKTGKDYRLLSEAEWEYAARAGTSTPFSTGKRITASQANFDSRYTYNGSKKGKFRNAALPVGSFPANRFGLHDMHGNMAELTEDCWNPNHRNAPTNGAVRTTGNCGKHVLRGSSWLDEPWFVRSAYRYGSEGGRSYDKGFRVARTLP